MADVTTIQSPRAVALQTRIIDRLYAHWAWGRERAIKLEDLFPGTLEHVPVREIENAVSALERDGIVRTFTTRVRTYVGLNPLALDAILARRIK